MEEENAEEKIRQAVLVIRKSRTNPAGRHWLDVAEGFLVQALALSSPHPEAREEDIRKALTTREVRDAIGRFRGVAHLFDLGDMSAESDGNILADAIGDALDALSRLAAPKPEGQKRKPANPKNPCADCKNGIGPRPDAICDECEGDESDLPSMWEPAPAPEPRPAEEPANLCEGCGLWPCGHHSPIGVRGCITTECANRKPTTGQLVADLRSQLARKDEALKEIRTNWGGYMVTKESPWEKTLAAMWKEVQRMDGLARAALREPDGQKGE